MDGGKPVCEILVYTQNSSDSQNSIYQNCKLPKRGDVVTIQPDGWPWGNNEVGDAADPWFMVIKIQGVDAADLASLVSWEVSDNPSIINPIDSTNTLQYRGFFLDLDATTVSQDTIPAALVAMNTPSKFVANGKSSDQAPSVGNVVYLSGDSQTILAMQAQRTPVDDPAVIGNINTHIIGPSNAGSL